MVLNNTVNRFKSNIDSPVNNFKITASPKAFKILSSNLYKRKIDAVIRELSCNAYDSHVEAGKEDIPFQIHLPSKYEPYFSVKDFGIGMDNDEIQNLYTSYFDSTKTERNDVIGALGLGSKSPFAYTTTFNVISVKNGVRRSYVCFLNEEEVPSILMMEETPTVDSNGVEINFEVSNNNDQESFVQSAIRILLPFPVKPSITGRKIDLKDFSEFTLKEGKNFRVLTNSISSLIPRNSYNAVYVSYGNIVYPIPLDIIWKENDSLRKFITILFNYTILLVTVPLGELDIAPSREELSLDKRTKQVLHKRLTEVIDSISTEINETIDSSDTFLEAYEYLHTTLADVYSISREYQIKDLMELPQLDLKWKNYVLGSQLKLKMDQDSKDIILFRVKEQTKTKIIQNVYSAKSYDNEITIPRHYLIGEKEVVFVYSNTDEPKYLTNLRKHVREKNLVVYLYKEKKSIFDKALFGKDRFKKLTDFEQIKTPRKERSTPSKIEDQCFINIPSIYRKVYDQILDNQGYPDSEKYYMMNMSILKRNLRNPEVKLLYKVKKWNSFYDGTVQLSDHSVRTLEGILTVDTKILIVSIPSSKENPFKKFFPKSESLFEYIDSYFDNLKDNTDLVKYSKELWNIVVSNYKKNSFKNSLSMSERNMISLMKIVFKEIPTCLSDSEKEIIHRLESTEEFKSVYDEPVDTKDPLYLEKKIIYNWVTMSTMLSSSYKLSFFGEFPLRKNTIQSINSIFVYESNAVDSVKECIENFSKRYPLIPLALDSYYAMVNKDNIGKLLEYVEYFDYKKIGVRT